MGVARVVSSIGGSFPGVRAPRQALAPGWLGDCLGGQVELEWPAIGRGWCGAPQQRVGQAQDRERSGRLALPRKDGLHDVLPRRPQQVAGGGEVVEEQGVARQAHALVASR